MSLMMEQTYPRMLYRGAEDETAEACAVPDADAEALALKDGWRTKRVPTGVVADVIHAVTGAVTGHPAKKAGKS
jgi:hypothetical protein